MIQSVTVKFVDYCGGDAAAWRTVAIIYAIIGLIVNTISAFSVKELPEEELNEGEVKGDEEKYGLVQAFKLLVKNKYYMMICGTYILQQLYSAMIGAGIYYMTWVLKNKNLFGQFAWAVNIPLIIALIFTPTLVGKWNGMYKLNLRGYIIAVIGRALVVVAGYMGSIPYSYQSSSSHHSPRYTPAYRAGRYERSDCFLFRVYLSDTGKEN